VYSTSQKHAYLIIIMLEGHTSFAIVSIAFGIIVDGSIVLIVEILNCVLGCGGMKAFTNAGLDMLT
jgi:hypothetical protein